MNNYTRSHTHTHSQGVETLIKHLILLLNDKYHSRRDREIPYPSTEPTKCGGLCFSFFLIFV